MEQSKQSEQSKHSTPNAQHLAGDLTGRLFDTATLWADVNQRALRDWIDVSTAAAKEGAKLCGELQRTALEAVRESQAALLGWQATWLEGPKDPIALYQKFLSDTVSGAQKAVRLAEDNAQAVTRAAERVHVTAQEAGKGIQDSYKDAVSKTREIYARS